MEGLVETDVVVLGSGAAGLVAALAAADAGARVAVLEKADAVGGTTALSGGVFWLPANRFGAEAGITDGREQALAYLDALSLGLIDPAMATTYVDSVAPLLDWLTGSAGMQVRLVPGFPDYHPEHPGGMKDGGRSLEPGPFPMPSLGPWAERVLRGRANPWTMIGERPRGDGSGGVDGDTIAARRRDGIECCGRALVGWLLKACLDRGIEPMLDQPVTDLLHDENGRVTGVRAGDLVVKARRGVIIATGGFEWDRELARDFLRGPVGHMPTARSCTGDGLRMAMRAGAALTNMAEAWWVPTIAWGGPEAAGDDPTRHFLLLRERTLPGSIMVNRMGRRFANEATNYNAFGAVLHEFDPVGFTYANQPCWLVFGQNFLDRYGFFGLAPGDAVPDWIARGDSVEALADVLGLPPAALADTVARWNRMMEAGRDDDFGRGTSAYDSWNGDVQQPAGSARTLGPLDRGPFYAVPVHASTLGTKGGPKTDGDGAVLDLSGRVIPGLYAAGNAMGGVTGKVYGGAGGTLGPAMIFGWRAGRAAALSNDKN
ncbi:FAD-dependent oxidoreductase [Niveispirillum sp. KHB5.9]|uniref:FAD-dependent oxidoreductase n=1 Tax=Niveispirillum sp. KHB5.9 TaxID=3400269 RepID=UPI003A84074F